MRLSLRLLALLFTVGPTAPALAAPACPPEGWPLERLEALRQSGFVVADPGELATLAYALSNCLAASDPDRKSVV